MLVAYTANKQAAIIGLTMAVGLGGFTWSGFPVNHLDIAPRYAGVLFGISNCVATLPGILSPLLVGFLTPGETQTEWRVVFLMSAGIYVFGMLFYAVCGSGEKQSWSEGGGGGVGGVGGVGMLQNEEMNHLIPRNQ